MKELPHPVLKLAEFVSSLCSRGQMKSLIFFFFFTKMSILSICLLTLTLVQTRMDVEHKIIDFEGCAGRSFPFNYQ